HGGACVDAVSRNVTVVITSSNSTRESLNFQFIASGPDFDVDGFLAATGLRCDSIFRRGEKYKSTGLRLVIGKAEELVFEEQLEAAIRFVDQNREVLSELRQWPGLRGAEIIFSPEVALTGNTVCTRSYMMPASLVQSCAALGLELGVAVRLKWPEELE